MSRNDLGATVSTRTGAVRATAGTTNGPAIDRRGFQSCVLHLGTGAATGGPSAQTADAKLQHSADGSTNWTDLAGAATAQVAADDGQAAVDVDLRTARGFIRVVAAVALTGGTSPTWPVGAFVTLGGSDTEPV